MSIFSISMFLIAFGVAWALQPIFQRFLVSNWEKRQQNLHDAPVINRYRRAIVAASFGVITAVAAQQADDEVSMKEEIAASSKMPSTVAEAASASTTSCAEIPNASERLGCTKQAFESVDKELNTAWRVLKRDLPDAEFTPLQGEQGAWNREKEMRCIGVGKKQPDVSLQDIAYWECMQVMTAERVSVLKAKIAAMGG